MLPLIQVLFGAVFTVAAAYGLGRAVTRHRSLSGTAQFAIGAALLSSAIFFLRLGGWAQWPEFLALGALGMAGFVLNPPERPARPEFPPFVLLVLAVFTAIYSVYALAPEIQSDPNTYHLMPAVEAQSTGGFASDVTFYDRLPQGIENLFAMAYAFGGSSSAKLVHFAFLLAAVPLIISVLDRLAVPQQLAAIAAAIYFCTPVVGVDGTSAFNDAALVFFTLAVLDLLLAGAPVYAGLVAGFCYAIKMTGGITVAVGLVYLFALRRWRASLVFTLVALVMVAPWVIRNIVEVGNPVAPVMNAWFPNPYFTVSGEQALVSWFHHYGLTRPTQLPMELTIHGRTLQGMLGPAFLVAPIALIALRSRTGRILVGLAVILSIPWQLNWGTRFLMPTLPFLVAAIILPLPRIAATALLAIHAITSFPWMIDVYSPDAWHLNGFPIAAALRVESESNYMKRVSWDYNVAQMIEANTQPSDRILDLHGVQSALVHRTLVSDWQSSTGDRLRAALQVAQNLTPGVFYDLRAGVPPAPYMAVRVRQAASPENWSLQEIELWNGGERIANSRKWSLAAWPNEWFAPYAFDVNWISGWSTWQHARPGMYLETTFDRPLLLTAINIVGLSAELNSQPEIYLQSPGGTWFRATAQRTPHAGINLRRNATRFISRAGIRYLLVPTGNEGNGPLGVKLTETPADWGVDKIANYEQLFLLKIQ